MDKHPATSTAPRVAFGSWAFSFGPYASDPWSFDRVCRYVADAGYDGIDINGFRPHPHDEDYATVSATSVLKAAIQNHGLSISAFAPDFTTAPPADAPLEDYLARVDSALRFCQRMDISILRTDTIAAPGPFDPARFHRLTTAWTRAAERCADAGVDLVWEFEPGFWLSRPSEVFRVLDAVTNPAFGILFDTSHAYMTAVMSARQFGEPEHIDGGVARYATLLADRIKHFHIIDSDGTLHDEDTSEHVPFGRGLIDFDDLVQAVAPVLGRLPWWTVDFCFWPDTERDAASAVPFVHELINTTQNILERTA
ncbi:hypothetical protein GCM10025867_02240 [Frondihabitans sucicola]|uniref:Xylose isomerase-like TIM barrel domain-containing protein n=1 Tax=Frondihabitans sucicola TaxID=1268041 RepID=A0ABN6XSU9_9MICO|nr:sugar phosphate isomerase/epimerase family protein [Frondihabitans sucicola]BDZ47983.1 hypothetical protein GCM10025867_02240 [Frondihabitans sucicola]